VAGPPLLDWASSPSVTTGSASCSGWAWGWACICSGSAVTIVQLHLAIELQHLRLAVLHGLGAPRLLGS
jgi:hypothetical protein